MIMILIYNVGCESWPVSPAKGFFGLALNPRLGCFTEGDSHGYMVQPPMEVTPPKRKKQEKHYVLNNFVWYCKQLFW